MVPQWRRAIGLRAGFSPDTEVLPLRTVLTFARIRPVDRDVAKRLLDRSAAGALGRIVGARMEDQWELWDVLNLMHAAGYDVTRLWKADPTDPEALCAVVAPEDFRLYSIASATAGGRARARRSCRARGRSRGRHGGRRRAPDSRAMMRESVNSLSSDSCVSSAVSPLRVASFQVEVVSGPISPNTNNPRSM